MWDHVDWNSNEDLTLCSLKASVDSGDGGSKQNAAEAKIWKRISLYPVGCAPPHDETVEELRKTDVNLTRSAGDSEPQLIAKFEEFNPRTQEVTSSFESSRQLMNTNITSLSTSNHNEDEPKSPRRLTKPLRPRSTREEQRLEYSDYLNSSTTALTMGLTHPSHPSHRNGYHSFPDPPSPLHASHKKKSLIKRLIRAMLPNPTSTRQARPFSFMSKPNPQTRIYTMAELVERSSNNNLSDPRSSWVSLQYNPSGLSLNITGQLTHS